MRPYQATTAVAVALLGLLAMFDSRRDLLFHPAAGGVGPGFYPFWSAALMVVAALVVAYQALSRPQPAEGVFRGQDSVTSVLKLVLPMFVYAASLPYLGFYVATALYMGFYASYLGHYRWPLVLAVGLLFPLAIYFSFELGFRLALPKSMFYTLGLPF
jgi:hypothetical protein